jgi:hypothetical protein
MKITMESYSDKQVTFELKGVEEVSEGLGILQRYVNAACRSGDREKLREWGVLDDGESEEN